MIIYRIEGPSFFRKKQMDKIISSAKTKDILADTNHNLQLTFVALNLSVYFAITDDESNFDNLNVLFNSNISFINKENISYEKATKEFAHLSKIFVSGSATSIDDQAKNHLQTVLDYLFSASIIPEVRIDYFIPPNNTSSWSMFFDEQIDINNKSKELKLEHNFAAYNLRCIKMFLGSLYPELQFTLQGPIITNKAILYSIQLPILMNFAVPLVDYANTLIRDSLNNRVSITPNLLFSSKENKELYLYVNSNPLARLPTARLG